MVYTALPDRRIAYDNDGTVFGYRSDCSAGSVAACFAQGMQGYVPGAAAIEFNDDDYASPGNYITALDFNRRGLSWHFFPEQREVTGLAWGMSVATASFNIPTNYLCDGFEGSNDSGNGADGTWEAASLISAHTGGSMPSLDGWRTTITAVSFTGGKRTVRGSFKDVSGGSSPDLYVYMLHLYGEKVAGQTPDDVIYINHDDTPGVEFTAPEDFGDQPLGTTVVRQWRLKNTSATKTANSINIQCNDSDFAISEDGVVWVTTINIASLSAGAESATLYVRCTTPAPGNPVGPRFSRIVTTVGSYT